MKLISTSCQKLFFVLIGLLAFVPAFAQSTQTLRGVVRDAETLAPIIGANVVVTDLQPVNGAQTDIDGKFEITEVPTGRHDLQVSYIGYKTQQRPGLVVTSGKELNLDFKLELNQGPSIVITAEADKSRTKNELNAVSGRLFTIDETNRYAGTRGDPSRMAANYAGVASANDGRNDIVVRGNSPSGLLWRLEGLDISNPNHFAANGTTGGPVSVLNNNTLDNSDFLTGAFSAQFGNALSGVFDLSMRTGNPSKHEYTGQFGFNGLELNAEGPISLGTKRKPATYLVAYRYSTLELLQKMGINFGTSGLPKYQDGSLRIDIPGEKLKGTTTLFAIGGRSNIHIPADPDPNSVYNTQLLDINFKSDIQVVGLRRTILHKNGYSSLTIGYNHEGNSQTIDTVGTDKKTLALNRDQQYGQGRVQMHYFYNRRIGKRNVLRIGLQEDLMNYELSERHYWSSLQTWQVNNNSKGSTSLTRAYIQTKWAVNSRFTVLPGVHAMHFALNNKMVIEPRLGATYQTGLKTQLTAGLGMHSRLQTLATYFTQTTLANGTTTLTNKQLDYTKALHAVLGFQWFITPKTRLKSELYYQHLYQVPVSESETWYSALDQGAYFGIPLLDSLKNKGKGRNYGVELTLERFMQKGYYYLVTASLYDSRTIGADNTRRNSAFNGHYVANALIGKEWKAGKKGTFTFDGRAAWLGGKLYTPVDFAKTVAKNDGNIYYDHSQQYALRAPDYLRFDIRIGYRRNGKKITQEWAASVENVANRRNVLEQTFDFSTGKVRYIYQLGLFPIALYKITF